MSEQTDTVDQFQELYALRESLAAQQEEATPITADIYQETVEKTNSQLAEVAQAPEVQEFLAKLGGTAVRGFKELESLEQTGLVDDEVLQEKKMELEALRDRPEVKMALEFLDAEELPRVRPVRERPTATDKQIEFARSLDLEDIDENTPRSVATKRLTQEIKKRGRKVLNSGEWKIYDAVNHPKRGKCEIVNVHDKSVKVTLQPIEGGKKFVINAMNLAEYKKIVE